MGAGYGSIIPITDLEIFIDTLYNIIGSSLFTAIFVDFVTEYSMLNLTVFLNQQLQDETLIFAERVQLPINLIFKIKYYFKNESLKYQDFIKKQEIVAELPESIQGQVSLIMNKEII